MGTFTYTARSGAGEKLQGSLDADDRRAALKQIEQMGCFPISVTEGGGVQSGKPKKQAAGKKKHSFKIERSREPKMKTFDVLIFATELSDLLAAGMTLGHALNLLAHRVTGRTSDIIIPQLRDDIVQGQSLSAALAKHPKSFSALFVSMIQAGEASGALPEVLRRLVDHYERLQEVKDKIITALVYPAIVLIVGLATVVFALVWVVPRFERVFEDLGATLPLPTRILMGLSKWMTAYGWIVAACGVIFFVLASRTIKTKQGQYWWHGFLLKLPLIKGILAAGTYSNFARTLATLLTNGVPVLQALSIVEKTVSNVVIAREISNARDKVTDGTTISGPLASGKVFPRMMTDMLSVGEQTGNVTGVLAHVARRYEHQLDRSIKIFTTALEPILIFFIAILVGFVALSILSAVFNLTSGLDVPT